MKIGSMGVGNVGGAVASGLAGYEMKPHDARLEPAPPSSERGRSGPIAQPPEPDLLSEM